MPTSNFAVNFPAALAALEAECGSRRSSYEWQERFVDLHLAWAEAASRDESDMALVQFRAAEDCQRQIASLTADTGDERLAAIATVYEIMARRACLLERLAASAPTIMGKLERFQEARALWLEIVSEPNGLGESHRSRLERVEARLRAFR